MSWYKIAQNLNIPPILYHGTSKSASEYILKEGLSANGSYTNWNLTEKGFVYLSKTPKQAEGWAFYSLGGGDFGNETNETAGAVLSINTSLLDNRLFSIDPKNTIDLRYAGDILPQAISKYLEYDWEDRLNPKCKVCGKEEWKCECEEGFSGDRIK